MVNHRVMLLSRIVLTFLQLIKKWCTCKTDIRIRIVIRQVLNIILLVTFDRGYEQMEVTCNPNVHDTNNLWNIEDNVFPKCKYVWKLCFL